MSTNTTDSRPATDDDDSTFNFDQSLASPDLTGAIEQSDVEDILTNNERNIEPAHPFIDGTTLRFDITDTPYLFTLDLTTGHFRFRVVTAEETATVYELTS